MISQFLLVATFAVNQGQVLPITVPHESGMTSMTVKWEDENIPFVRVGNEYQTLLGIDLETKPGEYRAEIAILKDTGATEKRDAIIRVSSTKFPTTRLKVADKYVQLNPADEKRAAVEAVELDRIYKTVTIDRLWDIPFTVPIPGGTGTNFGHRRVFNGQSRNPHAGADLKASTGTPIHSTNRGRVVLARDLFFTGNTVVVDHGLGIFIIYAHLSKLNVKPGDLVENGAVLGLAGATGRVTGPHLHWSARVQGARVDPFSLVNVSKSK